MSLSHDLINYSLFVYKIEHLSFSILHFTFYHRLLLQVDGKVRTDPKFPAGFMDVIQIEKTGENFRLIYDVKGRSVGSPEACSSATN